MKRLQQYMNVPFGSRLMAFLLLTVLMLILTSVLLFFIAGTDPTTPRLRIATVLQDILLFIVPALLTAIIASRRPAQLLLLNPLHRSVTRIVLIIVVAVVSIPAMNFLVQLNEQMQLPESMSAIEQWMQTSEESAQATISILMGEPTLPNLFMNLLIVALLAGLSEEIFFRGALQQLLITRPMNPHAAIWITAILFSAFHLQFYGFLPRLLLGAYFGYLAWWSRSLWLPIAAHALNNSFVVVSEWLTRRGDTTASVDDIGTDGSPLSIILVAASAILTAATLYALYRARTHDSGNEINI